MTDRTSDNPDDYTGTECLRGVIDAWGFDVLAYDDDAPSITVRPRDPRFDTMAAHLNEWLLSLGVEPEHFKIYKWLGLGQIEVEGLDDRRVMQDRADRKERLRIATIAEVGACPDTGLPATWCCCPWCD